MTTIVKYNILSLKLYFLKLLKYILDSTHSVYVYVGKTKQYLKKRIYYHKYSVNNNLDSVTALVKHSNDSQHYIDFDNTTIIIKKTLNLRNDKH